MNWRKIADLIFPILEPFDAQQAQEIKNTFRNDIEAIRSARWSRDEELALEEAQRIAAAETERVKTAESKASTYLLVLAALVPVIITIESANWEKTSGPAPEWAKLIVLVFALIYTFGAGLCAFKTLKVTGFHRVGEAELVLAWRSHYPRRQLIRQTLVASRSSRSTVNAKVSFIRIAHEYLIRAFAAFIVLLLLDPICSIFISQDKFLSPEQNYQYDTVIISCSLYTSSSKNIFLPIPHSKTTNYL